MIKSRELVERSGASYRQLHYWVTERIVYPIGDSSPGSGHTHYFEESVIPKVTLLANISQAFQNAVPCEILKKIYDDFDKGYISLDHNIILSW